MHILITLLNKRMNRDMVGILNTIAICHKPFYNIPYKSSFIQAIDKTSSSSLSLPLSLTPDGMVQYWFELWQLERCSFLRFFCCRCRSIAISFAILSIRYSFTSSRFLLYDSVCDKQLLVLCLFRFSILNLWVMFILLFAQSCVIVLNDVVCWQ